MPDMTEGAFLTETVEDGARHVEISGRMTIRFIDPISARLRELQTAPEPLTIDLGEIERIDTSGAWVLHRTRLAREEAGLPFTLSGASEKAEELIQQICAQGKPVKIRPDDPSTLVQTIATFGAWIANSATTFGSFLAFLGLTLVALARVLFTPRTFRWRAVTRQFEVVGVSALGIIGLMSFLIGIVIAQQGAVQLRAVRRRDFLDQPGRADRLARARRADDRDHGRRPVGQRVRRADRHDEARRGNRRDAHDRRLADRGAGAAAHPRRGADDAAAGFYAAMVGDHRRRACCWATLGIPPADLHPAACRKSCRSTTSGSG